MVNAFVAVLGASNYTYAEDAGRLVDPHAGV